MKYMGREESWKKEDMGGTVLVSVACSYHKAETCTGTPACIQQGSDLLNTTVHAWNENVFKGQGFTYLKRKIYETKTHMIAITRAPTDSS
jgi:hypothetical protein